jgi:hypothetical protein
MIPLFNGLKYVIICSVVRENQIHDAIEKWCESNNVFYVKCTEADSAKENIQRCVECKTDDEMALIVYDDFNNMRAGVARSNDRFALMIRQSFNFLRNYGFSCIIISQSPMLIDTKVRASCNLRILFRCDNAHAVQQMGFDVSAIFINRKYDFLDIYKKYVLPAPHNSLYVRTCPEMIFAYQPNMDKSKKCQPGVFINVLQEMDAATVRRTTPRLIGCEKQRESPAMGRLNELTEKIMKSGSSRERNYYMKKLLTEAREMRVPARVVNNLLYAKKIIE